MSHEKETKNLQALIRNIRILRLIQERRWPTLRKYIWSPEGQREALHLSRHDVGVEWGILHLLSAYDDVPCDIVQSFIVVCPPGQLAARDRLGRTPLHVAARFSTGLDVITCLVNECPVAATLKDRDGKTPLILACENMAEGPFWGEGVGGQYRLLQARATIKALIDAGPALVAAVDDSGRSALDYLVAGGAPDEVSGLVEGSFHGRNALQTETASTLAA